LMISFWGDISESTSRLQCGFSLQCAKKITLWLLS
jgi:hypothetical protein